MYKRKLVKGTALEVFEIWKKPEGETVPKNTKYIVIQYIPDGEYIDIFKVEAENFEGAWLKMEKCVRKRLFSEMVLLTDKQFIKLVKKIKKFIGFPLR